MTHPATVQVLTALARGGVDARFVGGCVRDAILRRPVRDVDIATHAPPDEVMLCLGNAGIRVIPTGIAHGTVTAVVDHKPFEITTLRRDVETFGRHARVVFTDDWKADAARRDFTMNAIFCAPDGTLYDPFEGLKDMAAGRVRFVGTARIRIEEDVLRLLRFFRFQAHYGRGFPDPDALDACRELAWRLPELSGERVRAELLRLLAAPEPATIWRLMNDLAITPHLLPVPDTPEHLDRLTRLQTALGIPAGDDPLLRLAALVRTGKAGVLSVASHLRLSGAERDRLATLVAPPVEVGVLDTRSERIQALYRVGANTYLDLVMLAASRNDDFPSPEDLIPAFEAAAEWQSTAFPLKGRDLIALGVPPGPRVGALLQQMESWWLEADCVPDHVACLCEARQRLAALA